ncbi:hypothetical protein RHSIM_Rhsim01G0127500 [Rhododendron simsii]|uniref:Uncharacterized protein n=1 Tax=Rhododendron simsii TaxID=118357 RepID=A0A834M1S7_RHOSS|nr:hypothetical protein RHSIM_Rhsim01G0127500 [Rhododendron simsii]
MWVFYLISLPLTMGMVVLTLRYFAGPDVPRYVLFTVEYTWFCSLSIIILVPADIWTTIIGELDVGLGQMLDCWAGTLAKLVLGLGMGQLAAAVG